MFVCICMYVCLCVFICDYMYFVGIIPYIHTRIQLLILCFKECRSVMKVKETSHAHANMVSAGIAASVVGTILGRNLKTGL